MLDSTVLLFCYSIVLMYAYYVCECRMIAFLELCNQIFNCNHSERLWYSYSVGTHDNISAVVFVSK